MRATIPARRSRETCERLSDIYNGKVWSDFLTISGQPFLQSPFSLALMLNVDWFQPFKHTTYSVGAVYITIMNLPWALHFKCENVILLALIPGPSEPAQYVNRLLQQRTHYKVLLLSRSGSICPCLLYLWPTCRKEGLWICRTLCLTWMLKVYGGIQRYIHVLQECELQWI